MPRVDPRPRALRRGGDVDVRVAGPPAVLAPLVAGGAGWRLKGARVSGRRRRLWPLLRARRAPVALEEIALLGVPVDPALLLRALAAAIEPEGTSGDAFSVVYEIGGAAQGTVHVAVADGAPVAVAPGRPVGVPAATLIVPRDALTALLARLEPPAGEAPLVLGDAAAVERLHGWFDRAQ